MVVKNPAIHGKGLFAKERIRKGEKIVVFGGYKVDKNLVSYLYDRIGDYTVQIDDNIFLAQRSKADLGNQDRINHSCEA